MSETLNLQYHFVNLLYEIAYLEGRRQAGMRLSWSDNKRLRSLSEFLTGDPGWARRKYRRLPMMVPAAVKHDACYGGATVLNMSAGGAYLESRLPAKEGDWVLVKIGQPGTTQYSFPCEVRRVKEHGGRYYLALAFKGIPLEVRYGNAGADDTPKPLRLPPRLQALSA